MAGWHRLAGFAAYLCALACEVCWNRPLVEKIIFGCTASIDRSDKKANYRVNALYSMPTGSNDNLRFR